MCGIEEGALEYLHTGPPQPCYATGQYNCRRLRVFSRACQVRVELVECEHWQDTTRFVFMKSIGNGVCGPITSHFGLVFVALFPLCQLRFSRRINQTRVSHPSLITNELINGSTNEWLNERGRWNRETWQLGGTRLNRLQRFEHPSAQEKNRTCWTISELNPVCHDSTAALIVACSFWTSGWCSSFQTHGAEVISRWTRGNAVPIVEKLPKRSGTAIPLLKCLRTYTINSTCIMDGISNHFPVKMQIAGFCVYNLKNFRGGVIPRTSTEASPVLDPDTNFRLAC